MGVPLRRGFKSEADAYAKEFRIELGIAPSKPLDMFLLARHLEVPAVPLSHLRGDLLEHTYDLLTQATKSPFSAVTLFVGRRRGIVFNDTHSTERQQSDMAHELAHAILDHPPGMLTDESGGRHYNKELEDEAACLSGVLLIPKDAAIAILASKKPATQIVTEYNVSLPMVRMRLYQSGAMKIMKRTRWGDD